MRFRFSGFNNPGKIKALYFIFWVILLFAFSYRPNPQIIGDGPSYLQMSQQLSVTGCFLDPPQDSSIESKDPIELKRSVTGRDKIERCFFFMERPFFFLLLLKMLGAENFNLFQNIIKAIAWSLFAFAMFRFPFHKPIQWFLHASLFLYYFLNLEYNHEIGTEDLNLSLWLLNLSLLLKILYRDNTPKKLHFSLWLSNGLLFVLLYVRDSNFVVLAVYTLLVYACLALIFKTKILTFKLFYLQLGIGVLILTSSYISINYTQRYERHFYRNLLWNIGGEYYPNKEPTATLYLEGDRQWFFDHYPELKALGVDTIELRKWSIENIRTVWSHYVLSHLGFFLELEVNRFFIGTLNQFYPLFIKIFLIVSGLLLLFQFQSQGKVLFFLTVLAGIVGLDYFIALVGDIGPLDRQANLSAKLIKLWIDLLICFGLFSLLQIGSAFLKRKSLLFSGAWGGLVLFGIFSWGGILGALFYQQGIQHYYKQQYAEMVEDLNKSKILRSAIYAPAATLSGTYQWLGNGFLELKQYDQAYQHFSKAIELNSQNWISYRNRGILERDFYQQSSRAVDDFTNAIQSNPHFAELYRDRGNTYFALKQYHLAAKDLFQSLTLDPSHYDTYLTLSRIHFQFQQYAQALLLVNHVLIQKPEMAKAYEYRGIIYWRGLQNLSDACENFMKACELGSCKMYQLSKNNQICQ